MWDLTYALAEEIGDPDLFVGREQEMAREVTRDAVRHFIEVKEALADHLRRRTVFLFYSESGPGEESAAELAAAGVLILDAEKLAGFETPSGL